MPTAGQYARTGLMARSSLDPQSANVMLNIDYVPPMWGVMHHRSGFADTTTAIHTLSDDVPGDFEYAAPIRLRLTRTGDLFTGSVSRDRIDWYRVGHVTIPMSTGLLVGMAVTSHSEEVLHTGVFGSLEVQ